MTFTIKLYLYTFVLFVLPGASGCTGSARGPSEAYKRGRIKRGCSQKPYLQIGGKTGPRHIQNTGRVP